MITSLYTFLVGISVLIHISELSPSIRHPHQYSLSTCSGVFISPNEILTAEHCIEHSRGHQWIKTDDGKTYPVSIEKQDKYKDLALLKINTPIHHKYASLGTPGQITDLVTTVNSSEGLEGTFAEGMINNIIEDEQYGALSILHSAVIAPGASGSGLFNSKGQLIGINTALVKGFSEAVDLLEIRVFLNVR